MEQVITTPKTAKQDKTRPVIILNLFGDLARGKEIAKEHNAEFPSLKELVLYLYYKF